MPIRTLIRLLVWAVVFCASQPASAQIFESVGTRAQGMGGAFVALADDATATWWNPAGLAGGPFFSSIVERGFVKGTDEATLGIAFGVPSLGLSYYRVRITTPGTVAGSTESGAANRQDQGPTIPSTYVMTQVGATVGQSLGNHLVLASTAKLVRADNTKADVDIGGMLKFGAFRLGAVLKHLYEPDLFVEGSRVGLDRQARVGLAYAPSPRPLVFNAAIDADVTGTETAFGRARHLAAGVEVLARQRLGIRAGFSVNTIDAARPAVSLGASAAVQRGTFIDARVTRGDDEGLRGWGIDLRLTF